MGRASSAKKVARAARAGGARRAGQRRALGFPILVVTIIILGSALVLFARGQRQANAAPRAGVDHWHAAYGIAECGDFLPALSGVGQDELGIHTHDDGLIHVEPLLDGAAGTNAKLRLFADYVGVRLTDESAAFPDGTEWAEASSECDGEPAEIVVARWIDGQDAADGERPNDVFTEGFQDIRFRNDREAFMIALIPSGDLESIPVRPDIVAELNDATEAPTTSTTPSNSSSSSTSTAPPGSSSSTIPVG